MDEPHALTLIAPAFKADLQGALPDMSVDYPDGGQIPEAVDAFMLIWLGRGGAVSSKGRNFSDALIEWRQSVHVAFLTPVTPNMDHATFQSAFTTKILTALARSKLLPEIALEWTPVEVDFAFGDKGGAPEMGGIITYDVRLMFDNNTGKARFV